MAFFFEFLNFVEVELVIIFDLIFKFFNTGVVTLLSNLPSIFGSIFEIMGKLFPVLDIVLWKFMLYNFGTIILLHFIGLIWKALPIV